MLITKEQALTVDLFHDMAERKWRRNGKTKVWVTRPNEFRIPVKFGLYQYGYITHLDTEFHIPDDDCVKP